MSRKTVLPAGLLAALVYGLMWVGTAFHWGLISAMDDTALTSLHTYAAERPGWVEFWQGVSAVLSPTSMRVVALVGIAAALAGRRMRIAGFLALTVLGMGLVTVIAKALADRPRPGTALAVASSSSFPSGHALGAMAAVLAFLAVGWPVLAPRLRLPLAVAGAGVIVLVGVSRVVLNVHHPSDVLAGWALGYLWFLFCLRVVPPSRQDEVLPSGV